MKTKLLEVHWSAFMNLCLKVKTKKEFVELFDCMLTAAEIEDIAARHAILHALLQGKHTQRELSKNLQISIAKITRCSNALRITDPKIKKLLTESSITLSK